MSCCCCGYCLWLQLILRFLRSLSLAQVLADAEEREALAGLDWEEQVACGAAAAGRLHHHIYCSFLLLPALPPPTATLLLLLLLLRALACL